MLSRLVPIDGTELTLRYRFGEVNRWYFRLVYEGCSLSAYDASYPLCLDGERADIPPGMLPMFFDNYLADNADDAHWRALHLVRAAAADPAFFNLAAVNTRLRLLGDDNRDGDERRAYDVTRVEITKAERRVVFEHGQLAADEREQIAAHATARELPVYLPEALALARNLAKAANRIGPGPLQRCLERLSGRFQRHAYAWLQLDREIDRSVKDSCFRPRGSADRENVETPKKTSADVDKTGLRGGRIGSRERIGARDRSCCDDLQKPRFMGV